MNNKVVFGRPDIQTADTASVNDVLKSGWIGMGAVTQLLEKAFVKFTGARYAAGVSSGSAGLFVAMLACGIGKGDEVITSPLTFPATANEILHTGAEVRFVDVDSSGNIDARRIRQAITTRTKAIVPVHLYGRPCDMDIIMGIARKYKLYVLEDAAHAFGASYRRKNIGSIGDASVFSLYATKNITAAEGGVVTTNNKKIADRIRLLRSYGITKTAWSRFGQKGTPIPYDTLVPGYNFEIPDMLSALALSQIHGYAKRYARRKQIWDRYDGAFKGLGIELPGERVRDYRHALHLYAVRIDKKKTGIDRKTFIERLGDMGIGTGIHFISLHLHSYYKKRYGCRPSDFPTALAISDQTLSLPLSSGMSDDEVDRVVHAVRLVCNG